MQSTVTSKGQVTIPKAVREALHLRAGDRLDFLIEPNGTVCIVPVTSSIVEIKGMLPPPDHALTLEQMDEAIAQGASRG